MGHLRSWHFSRLGKWWDKNTECTQVLIANGSIHNGRKCYAEKNAIFTRWSGKIHLSYHCCREYLFIFCFISQYCCGSVCKFVVCSFTLLVWRQTSHVWYISLAEPNTQIYYADALISHGPTSQFIAYSLWNHQPSNYVAAPQKSSNSELWWLLVASHVTPLYCICGQFCCASNMLHTLRWFLLTAMESYICYGL